MQCLNCGKNIDISYGILECPYCGKKIDNKKLSSFNNDTKKSKSSKLKKGLVAGGAVTAGTASAYALNKLSKNINKFFDWHKKPL